MHKSEVFLPTSVRAVAVVVGVLLMFAAGWLYFRPPHREVEEVERSLPTKEVVYKQTRAESDPLPLVIGMITAGSALVVYGLNGIRIFKFSMSAVSAETLGVLAETTSPVNEPVLVPAGLDQMLVNYLLRSSWNGLLVLKACQRGAQKKKPFSLRKAVEASNAGSYDYAYGYLIASFSVGAFSGYSDPGTGIVVIENVHKVVDSKIDEIIVGNIAVAPQLSALKTAQLGKLEQFFEAL